MGKGIRPGSSGMENMNIYVMGSKAYLSLSKIDKPVTIKTFTVGGRRSWRGNGWWDTRPYTYTAVPMEMLDSIRTMIKACGFKCTTYFVGHRPPSRQWTGWSRISGTTRKENAKWAKILVTDPNTQRSMYL